MSELRLLVIADVHYSSGPTPARCPDRCYAMGLELLVRAVEDASRRGGFDAIALLGDLIDDGDAPCADADLHEIRKALDTAAPGKPLLVVPGNHDGDWRRVFGALGDRPGLHEIAGYRVWTFADSYAAGDVCTRPDDQQKALVAQARRPGGPIIVLQHNPTNPLLVGDYPYMLTNRSEVMRDYSQLGVLACLSGHYHAGQDANMADGVWYHSAQALCERPYHYGLVKFAARGITVEQHKLVLDAAPPLVDCHCHTELAYCGSGTHAAGVVERARTFGLAGVCLTEHAPQLYCGKEQFWAGEHVRNPSATWQRSDRARMRQFHELADPLRQASQQGGPRVLVGLECELDIKGQLTLFPEDRAFADVVIGAVHFLSRPGKEMTPTQAIDEYMRYTLGLIDAKIDILAHPWRFLQRLTKVPQSLYRDLADRLAAAGTAAEINFHHTDNDPRFFAICAERGVKIALGSDSHQLHQVANLGGFCQFLRAAVHRNDVGPLLWQPK